MKPMNEILKDMLKVGTPACCVFCAVLAMIFGVLWMALGLWKTIMILLLGVIGAFIGGVQDKPAAIRRLVKRFVAHKDDK